MYVHGIRGLFAFEGYVVQKITMSGELVQVIRLSCRDCTSLVWSTPSSKRLDPKRWCITGEIRNFSGENGL